jgi:hypothetical protein
MSRHAARKTTDVQAEAPPTGPQAVTPAAAAAEEPRLGPGWKFAIVVWLVCFVGLGAYELVDVLKYAWRLVVR